MSQLPGRLRPLIDGSPGAVAEPQPGQNIPVAVTRIDEDGGQLAVPVLREQHSGRFEALGAVERHGDHYGVSPGLSWVMPTPRSAPAGVSARPPIARVDPELIWSSPAGTIPPCTILIHRPTITPLALAARSIDSSPILELRAI
jgi:hypothetical protein